jgi:esterase/lipase
MKLSQRIAFSAIKTKFKLLAIVNKKKAAKEAFQLFCTPQFKKKFDKPPAIFEKATALSFESDGYRIKGFHWNKGGDKRILIVHGFESQSFNFESYIAPLLKKNYEVIACDAPAHGNSSGQTVNVLLYRNMIVKINQLYGRLDGIIAHSFGCLATTLAAEVMPKGNYDKLVLIAPATETSSAIQSFFKALKIPASVLPAFEDYVLQLAQNPVSWYSIKRVLPLLRANVLWFHDEEDDVCPCADAKKVQALQLPNVEFVFTQGLGHRKIYRDSQVRKRIFDFLTW